MQYINRILSALKWKKNKTSPADVWSAMLDYEENGTFKGIPNHLIKCFPPNFLMRHVKPEDLQSIWFLLPESTRNNKSLQMMLPCYEHYLNNLDDYTHIDGPPPTRAKCSVCAKYNLYNY